MPVVSCDGGASYNPADDWTLQADAAPQRKPRHAYAAEAAAQGAEDAAQDAFELEQAAAPPTVTAAQAQLTYLETQIWRRPPTDPKKCRTYYALQRKAAQVEQRNPRQAHALRMQARALEEVSELLITATSCTDHSDSAGRMIDDHRQADERNNRRTTPQRVEQG